MDIFNASSKFENQIMSYKQDTELKILCYINKARAMFWFILVQNNGKNSVSN